MRIKFYGRANKPNGDSLASATVKIYLAGTTTPATVYTSVTSVSGVSQVTTDEYGYYTFYVSAFAYDQSQLFDLVLNKLGSSTTYTFYNIQSDNIIPGTYDIDENTSVLGHVSIPKGVVFNISNGIVLTFAVMPEIGLYSVFTGTGTVAFPNGCRVYIDWWNDNLATVVANIDTADATVVISDTVAIAENISVPSNICLMFEPPGKLDIEFGHTVTISKLYCNTLYQIFDGLGTISFGVGEIKEVYPEWWGFSPSASAANNTTYFNAAVASMPAGVCLVIIPGTYPITNCIFNPPDGCSLKCYGTLQGDSAGAAFTIGNSTGEVCLQKYNIQDLKVVQSTTSRTAGKIGVLVRNVYQSTIGIRYVLGYETGLKLVGDGVIGDAGVAYNHFHIGVIYDSKYSVYLLPYHAHGFVNENNFYGGQLTWAGSQDTTGFEHIHIEYLASNQPNDNKFWGTSLESSASTGAGHGTGINCGGYHNFFYSLRYELDTNDTWINMTSYSVGNVIFYGQNLYFTVTYITDSGTRNKFFTDCEIRINGQSYADGVHGVLTLRNDDPNEHSVLNILEKTGVSNVFSISSRGTLKTLAGFGCNGVEAQVAYGVSAAAATHDEAVTLVNQLRAALIANGICVAT